MALHKLFDNSPKFGAADIVGRVRSGAQINGRPVALTEWRFTTGDPDVAQAIAEKFGGSPQPWETSTEESLEIMTDTTSLPIHLTAIQSEFVLWGRGNTPIRSCNGETQKDDGCSACVCPRDLKEHKEAARAGSACQPSVRATFRLLDLPDLGLWRFNSASWQLASAVNEAEEALTAAGGEADGVLRLELVEYTTKNGRNVSYTKPIIEVAKVAALVS
jgi:hypothetical protein